VYKKSLRRLHWLHNNCTINLTHLHTLYIINITIYITYIIIHWVVWCRAQSGHSLVRTVSKCEQTEHTKW